MKAAICVSLAITMFLLVGAWYRWDAGKNHGYPFGYFGDYNRVRHALTSVPGVVVTQSWQTCSVSLKDFGFGVLYSNQSVSLQFDETDAVRIMGTTDAMITCGQRIRAEIAAARQSGVTNQNLLKSEIK